MDKLKTELNQQPGSNEEIEHQMLIPDFLSKARGPGSGPSYSPVWNYFVLDDDNPILATCLICGIRMSRGGITPNRCGTTNLRRHLSYAHGLSLPSKRRNAWASQTGSLPQASSSSSTNTQSQVHTSVMSQRTHFRPILPKKQPNQYYQPSNQSKSKVRLRWNSYYSNMQAAFPSLLYSEQFVDVTLACEGKSIKCHKVILSACSSYFEDLLTHNPCKHPIILMKDLRFWEVQALVDFMYNGEVNVQEDKLPSLLAAAEALQIKGLTGPSNNPSADGEMDEEECVPPNENCIPVIDENLVNKNPPTTKRGRKRKVAPESKQNNSHIDDHKTDFDTEDKGSLDSPVFIETVIKEEPVDVDLFGEPMCEIVEEEEEHIIKGSSSANIIIDNCINSKKDKPGSDQSSGEVDTSSGEASKQTKKHHRSQRENSKSLKVKEDTVNKNIPVKVKRPIKNESKSMFPRLRFILGDRTQELCDEDNVNDDDNDDGDIDKSKSMLKRIKTDSVSAESVGD